MLLLAPLAPFLAEEAWERLGHSASVHAQPWPAYDRALVAAQAIEIAVLVNSKVRDRLVRLFTAELGSRQ